MAIYVDVSGVAKVVETPYANVGGVWYSADRVFQNVQGDWQLVWPAPAVIDLVPTVDSWEQITLGWSVSGVLVDHYQVLRDGVELVAQTQATSLVDAGLLGGTTYTYTVRGYRDGNIAAEAVEAATTSTRSALNVSVLGETWDRVPLSWVDPDQGTADSYRVRRDTAVVAEGLVVKAWEDTGRLPGTTHDYLVEALRGQVVVGSEALQVTTPAYPSLGFTASASAWNSIALSWAALDGEADQAVLDRGTTNIYQGAGTSHTDGSRSASTTYTYTLEHRRSGLVLASSTKSATTPARPTTQKVVTLSIHYGGSFSGTGSKKNAGGPYYSGRYSSTWGRQKSAFGFNVPADVRNCVSVDKVEFACQNDHSYNNSGVTQYIAITHTQPTEANWASWPGSTGHFAGRATSKDGWWGGSQWQDITWENDPTVGTSVRNHFRTQGAWGICLIAPNDDIGYYSYWRLAGCQLRLTYTVYQ